MLRYANEDEDEDAEEAEEDEEEDVDGGYLGLSGVWRFFTSLTAALSAAHRTASRRSMGLSACIGAAAVVTFLADGDIACLTEPLSFGCPPEQKLTENVVAGELLVTVRNFGLLGPLSC